MKPITSDDLGMFPDYIASIKVYEKDGTYYATEDDCDRVEAGSTPENALLEYVSAVVDTP